LELWDENKLSDEFSLLTLALPSIRNDEEELVPLYVFDEAGCLEEVYEGCFCDAE
jgi:hypothetical protein